MASEPVITSSVPQPFTAAQKEYLAGFMAGVGASGWQPFIGHTAAGQITATPDGAATPNLAAPAAETFFNTPLSDLGKEERWKHDENPLDAWDRLLKHADENKIPDPEHTYRFKFFGLFHAAPAQDGFMLRLRIPACELTAAQLHGLADLASDLGGGYAHITTRGNLQIREFKPRDIINVLTRVQELGLTSRGAGADNIRNITSSPDSGFAPDEVLDVRPYAKALHHYILNHRDLYGLPRKFNVAFDNGGSLSVAADTNDIGFIAVRVSQASLAKFQAPGSKPEGGNSPALESGACFRVQLGGITGHKDFARDTGLLITPAEAVAAAVAMIRVFNENGCRTDRKKARLKYLLEKWGVEKFLAETEKKLAFPLTRLPLEACEPRRPVEKHAWLGARRQAQRGLNSLGVGVPVGRMSARQMHALADLAANYGTGELRLTVWQNLLIPHVTDAFLPTLMRSVQRLGFFTAASFAAGGIIACTGNRGCKYAAADTKAHALALLKHLEGRRVTIGAPVNLHFTGCPHSCAQHYCGDVGFVGAKLADGTEGYHVVLGGGMDHEQGIARELFKGVRASEVNTLVERVLVTYEAKKNRGETFVQWTRRHSVKELQEMLST
ncbi:MAG: NirA family protein [Verrucomicrobia bacterium]|nr:NirA family protein [Verrucomicrobiota bacterium]